MKRTVILIISIFLLTLPLIYLFFLLPKSIYPIKTIEYSQTNFDESYWKMSSTLKNNNGLTKLPHDFLSINKYFHNEITTDQQKELLKNGFTQMPGKYYQSFSSYYYDLLKSKIPVYITSDSVMNYSYNMLSSLRKEVVEKELIPKYIQWLDNGINYFTALKNDKKGNISELCDTNIAIFKESKKRLSDKPSFDTYIQSYSYLTQQYAKEEKPDSTILILLYNKRADTKSLFSKILTINSMFGISTDDLRLKVLDQDISSLVKRYKNVEEILRLETSRETFVQDEAIDGTSFYDSVFSNVENNWGDNENYTYRKDIVGDIYTVNVDDERWKGVKDITSTIAVEGDQSTYRLIIKYFSYVEDLLNKQGLLNDNSKGIIKTTIEDVSFMHNCSSVDCLKNNPEVLFDFFKNTGSINNLSDNSSLLVTEGIFSENNQLYVGPIYKSVGMNIDVIKGEVLGVSLFGNFNSGYDYAVRPQPRGSMRIPVLMYHNISPVPTSGSSSYRGLFVSPSMFEQQMAYLKLKGYKTITASEFFDDLKAGKNPKNKTVMITFDDGTRPQYTVAYPILKKYGLKAVYFIIADRLLISPSELKKMSNNGMDIESHSSTHPNLSKIGDVNRLRYELSHSKIKLESITGKKIVSIAYPGCVGGSRVFNLLGTYGYKLAFSCGTTIDHYYSWRPNLSRVHVFSDMYRFKKALSWGL